MSTLDAPPTILNKPQRCYTQGRNRSFHDSICKIVFDANVDADCGGSFRCRCNEGIERSLRFQLDYGLDSRMKGTLEAAN
jgi:hypothetical protein